MHLSFAIALLDRARNKERTPLSPGVEPDSCPSGEPQAVVNRSLPCRLQREHSTIIVAQGGTALPVSHLAIRAAIASELSKSRRMTTAIQPPYATSPPTKTNKALAKRRTSRRCVGGTCLEHLAASQESEFSTLDRSDPVISSPRDMFTILVENSLFASFQNLSLEASLTLETEAEVSPAFDARVSGKRESCPLSSTSSPRISGFSASMEGVSPSGVTSAALTPELISFTRRQTYRHKERDGGGNGYQWACREKTLNWKHGEQRWEHVGEV